MSDAADDLGSPPSSTPEMTSNFGGQMSGKVDYNPQDAQDASSLRFTAQPVTHVRLRLAHNEIYDPRTTGPHQPDDDTYDIFFSSDSDSD
tara:strand:+ start:245 stop:514 length:270 start_codon:yes stop_codon:yes gene_type:complete